MEPAISGCGIKAQIEEAKRHQQPVPADIAEERKRHAAQRRAAFLDQQEQEDRQVLEHQVNRLESAGEFSQARLIRQQITNLRADLERRY